MSYIVSITSQGQISIPAKLRRQLGFDKSKRAFVSEQDGKIVVESIKDLLDLKGSLKTNKKPLTDRKLHEFVEQAAADEYAEKMS